MSARSPLEWRERLLGIEARDGPAAALQAASEALAQHPRDAQLSNMVGNLAMRAGLAETAQRHFAAAARLAPERRDYAINHAIALASLGRHREALDALEAHRESGRSDARFCASYAHSAKALGRLALAAEWYERALALEPRHPRAALGRARVAIERCEPDARARFEAAIAANRADPFAWLGLAQVFELEGQLDEALRLGTQIAAQMPEWIDALQFLAQLRLARAEADFTQDYRRAVERHPKAKPVWIDWMAQLAALDEAEAAHEVARQARRQFPDDPQIMLFEATYASEAGRDKEAEAIFAALELDTLARCLQEARHRIRTGAIDRAQNLLDRALEHDPGSISAWALLGIVWRLSGDERADWLHGQAGLFGSKPLVDFGGVLDAARPLLHRLHDNASFPLGQSLRGGTQTRGNLFDRTDKEIAALHEAILASLEIYRKDLPPFDERHPLLRHRDKPWRIKGSWSVRLAGGGDYHASHIHPQGIVSSALYVESFDRAAGEDPQAGWLEIGRPPPDLRLDLEPLTVIEPKPATLALFPSTLYHGTRPFRQGRRMTVAFDIVVDE